MSSGPVKGAGPRAKAGGISQLLPCSGSLIQRRRRRWLSLVKYIVATLLFYILLRLRTFEIQEQTNIRSLSDPATVSEFLADFTNMKQLNPTIIDFEILVDEGLLEDWKYTVKYSEFLHNAPSIKNIITADYHVKKEADGSHIIDSIHTTCFFYSTYCVRAWGRFHISRPEKTRAGVNVVENVKFECPLIFYWFCFEEASYQRRQIKENLISHYDRSNLSKT